MSQELMLNGINADGLSYSDELGTAITAKMIARMARGQGLSQDEKDDLKRRRASDQRNNASHLGVKEGIETTQLEQTGWGAIFPSDLPKKSVDALKEALKPLLDLRREQAAALKEYYYREFSGAENGYRPGETKNTFLQRFGRATGPADPEKVPYYLMLVGSPETIPFHMQYQLDVQYAVGRIYFDKLEEYYQYAQSVVTAETKGISRGKSAAFFGVAHPDDRATQMSIEHLIRPLAGQVRNSHPDWNLSLVEPEQATKANLANHLGGAQTPSMLFTASHGMTFKPDDLRLLPHTGALLCQDWPGPQAHLPITDNHYFSAEDIGADANVFGMMAFFFACYGGGIPKTDNFYRQLTGQAREIAPYAFLSRLPMRLLSHPRGGALAVFAHIDRAWGSSILWEGSTREKTAFHSTIEALLNGKQAGIATEYFNERYAEISTDLTAELDSTTPEIENEDRLAGLWTANNDARNYALLGDPAARLVIQENTPQNSSPALEQNTPISLREAAAAFQNPESDLAPAIETENPPQGESFGVMDALRKPADAGALNLQIKEFLEKMGTYLSTAIDDAASLEISTYVASDLAGTQFENKKPTNAELRALTRIGANGNTVVLLPENNGQVDASVWEIHLSMVRQAQESRAEFIKTIVEAATNLLDLMPK